MTRSRDFTIRSCRRGWGEGNQGEEWNMLIGASGGALVYSNDEEKLALSTI